MRVSSLPPKIDLDISNDDPAQPNTFYFDATGTYDDDVTDNAALTYEWFMDGSPTSLVGGEVDRGYHTFTTL